MDDNLEKVLENKDYSKKRILIVEDDYTSFFFLEELLGQLHAEITHCEDGSLAVEKVKQENFDLVLMDIQMPNMNGYDATRKIKEIRPNLPIIAQTANALHSDRVKSIEAGCNDYISKPIMAPELIEKVSRFL